MEKITNEAITTDLEYAEFLESSMGFLKAIVNRYGPEKGMEVWETVADELEPEVKYDVFQLMIDAKRLPLANVLEVSVDPQVSMNIYNHRYVSFIRVIRKFTGFGIAESKDTATKILGLHGIQATPTALPIAPGVSMDEVVNELESYGATVRQMLK